MRDTRTHFLEAIEYGINDYPHTELTAREVADLKEQSHNVAGNVLDFIEEYISDYFGDGDEEIYDEIIRALEWLRP